jgi:hypothetical protein
MLDIVTDPYPQSNESKSTVDWKDTTAYHLSVRVYVCFCARFLEGFPAESVAFIIIISLLIMLSFLHFYPTHNI